MKRFILLSLLLCACTEAPREAWEMPNTYTPNPANNPATITLPSPGDLVAAGVVDQAFKDTIDRDSRKLDKIDGGTVSGDIVTSGAVTIGGTGVFIVDSGVSEEHDNTPGFINGATFSTGGTVSCSVPSTFSDTATFTDTTQAIHSTGLVDIDGANGGLYSGGANGSEFATDVLIDAKLTYNGSGHEVKRQIFPLGTTNHTYTISDGDRFVIRGLTASRDFTFQNTGAQNGLAIEIVVGSGSGFNAVIKRHDGTTLVTLQDTGTSGHVFGCTLWHDGTDWFVAKLEINP